MTLKIKTPRPGEVVMAKELDGVLYVPASTIAARDAQWLELVGPVVEAAERGLEYVEAELQQRKELYEPYGLERKWATEQQDADAIRAALRAITEEQK